MHWNVITLCKTKLDVVSFFFTETEIKFYYTPKSRKQEGNSEDSLDHNFFYHLNQSERILL